MAKDWWVWPLTVFASIATVSICFTFCVFMVCAAFTKYGVSTTND